MGGTVIVAIAGSDLSIMGKILHTAARDHTLDAIAERATTERSAFPSQAALKDGVYHVAA